MLGRKSITVECFSRFKFLVILLTHWVGLSNDILQWLGVYSNWHAVTKIPAEESLHDSKIEISPVQEYILDKLCANLLCWQRLAETVM